MQWKGERLLKNKYYLDIRTFGKCATGIMYNLLHYIIFSNLVFILVFICQYNIKKYNRKSTIV